MKKTFKNIALSFTAAAIFASCSQESEKPMTAAEKHTKDSVTLAVASDLSKIEAAMEFAELNAVGNPHERDAAVSNAYTQKVEEFTASHPGVKLERSGRTEATASRNGQKATYKPL